jgi:hypothetical protein
MMVLSLMICKIIQGDSRPQILPMTAASNPRLKRWGLINKIHTKSCSPQYLLKSLLL